MRSALAPFMRQEGNTRIPATRNGYGAVCDGVFLVGEREKPNRLLPHFACHLEEKQTPFLSNRSVRSSRFIQSYLAWLGVT
jgi:hypothetical protein